MSSLYEPNEDLESQILHGLLESPAFVRQALSKQIQPKIFLGQDRAIVIPIVTMLFDYFRRYGSLMTVQQILQTLERQEREKENDEILLTMAHAKKVLGQALQTRISEAELPFLLDSLTELYRSINILTQAKELERFYTCRFDHGKTERCKNCPIWTLCRGFKDQSLSFSDKVFAAQDAMRTSLKDATGVPDMIRARGSDGLRTSLDRYNNRRQTREQGGEAFTFGVPTPWPTVTHYTDGWKAKKLYGIWAEKKKGKTSCQMMVAGAAVRAGHSIVVFAMEDDDQEWMDKFFVQQAGVDAMDFTKGRLSPSEEDHLCHVVDEFEAGQREGRYGEIYQLHGPMNSLGLDECRSFLDDLKTQGLKFDLFLFDHMMIARRPRGVDWVRDDQRLNALAEGFKRLAQEYECAGVVAHQLKPTGERKGEGRGSDQLEDCFDAIYKLEEVKGLMQLRLHVSRYFGQHTVELLDMRHKLLLPEAEKPEEDDPLELGDLSIPDDGWIGNG